MRDYKPFVICGGQLKERCGTVCDFTDSCTFDVDGLDLSQRVSFYQKVDNDVVFCNPLYLEHVNTQIDLANKLLITHNTDSSLVSYDKGTAVFRYLSGDTWSVNNLHPRRWLAQNSEVATIPCIPLGVTNNDIMDCDVNCIKTKLLYKNFGIDNNPIERNACNLYVKQENEYNKSSDRRSYYESLAASYFTVSPNGYGIDCHRHWEALYFNCIPIVTDSQVVRHFAKHFPIVIIDKWENYDANLITVELYNKLISSFDRRFLDIDYFIDYYRI